MENEKRKIKEERRGDNERAREQPTKEYPCARARPS